MIIAILMIPVLVEFLKRILTVGRKIPLSEWLQTVGQNEVNNYAELVGAVGVLKWLEFSFASD